MTTNRAADAPPCRPTTVIRTFLRTLQRLEERATTENKTRAIAHAAREVKLLAAPVASLTEDGVFEGYASLFNVPDLGKDVVLPGAFADSLRRRGEGAIRMLWQHDPAQPIGRWLSIREDDRGLRVRGRLNLAVERARELHALIREGGVDGLSIGFRAERARHDRAGRRRLERIDLWEISLVTFPMLPGARVAAKGDLPDLIRRTARRLFHS